MYINEISAFIGENFWTVIIAIFALMIIAFFCVLISNTNAYNYSAKIDMVNLPEEFNNLYNEIYHSHLIKLNKLKKGIPLMKIIWWSTGALTLIICCLAQAAIFVYPPLLIITVLSGVITIIFFSLDNDATSKYKKYYKENCLKKFIELLNKNYSYTTKVDEKVKKDLRKVYRESECDNNIADLIEVDDYIEGKVKENTYIKLADTVVYQESSSRKESTEVIIFKGIFSHIDYKYYFNEKLKIEATKLDGFGRNKVQMDNSNFEKYFNVHCSNKILALRVLNHDLMECLLNFYNKCNLKFEITFYKNHIAFRFFSGPMFEPKIFGKSLDKEILYSYYVILEFIENVVNEISRVMNDFEV